MEVFPTSKTSAFQPTEFNNVRLSDSCLYKVHLDLKKDFLDASKTIDLLKSKPKGHQLYQRFLNISSRNLGLTPIGST